MTTQRVYTAAEGRRALATGRMPVDVPDGRVVGPRGMNKLEARYAQEVLEPMKRSGRIRDYGYERVTLKLADRLRLTVDFDVVLWEGLVELHETKGHWRDDARAKIKAAAELFPHFRFLAIRRVKREWVTEEFYPSALRRAG